MIRSRKYWELQRELDDLLSEASITSGKGNLRFLGRELHRVRQEIRLEERSTQAREEPR